MADEDEFSPFKTDEIIDERFKVVSKLGEGGFGAVYEVFDLQNNQSCALKAENAVKKEDAVLKLEREILRLLQGRKHICRYIGSGSKGDVNYLVMSMVGRSLSDLRKETKEDKFTWGTAIRLIKQCIESVEDIHSVNYLHRDLKPSNFALGRHEGMKRTVFMLDFGLARTVRYASINTHLLQEFSRADDLWCLFYMAVEMGTGNLPWRSLEDTVTNALTYRIEVGKMKQKTEISDLLKNCPPELFKWHEILSKCTYVDKPDYGALQMQMDKCLYRIGVKYDDPFDWETAASQKSQKLNATPSAQSSGFARLFKRDERKK